MNTHIVLINETWHRRPYGTRQTLCGEKVDPDISPGISQQVFERLDGEKGTRCLKCKYEEEIKNDATIHVEMGDSIQKAVEFAARRASKKKAIKVVVPEGIY